MERERRKMRKMEKGRRKMSNVRWKRIEKSWRPLFSPFGNHWNFWKFLREKAKITGKVTLPPPKKNFPVTPLEAFKTHSGNDNMDLIVKGGIYDSFWLCWSVQKYSEGAFIDSETSMGENLRIFLAMLIICPHVSWCKNKIKHKINK